MLGGGALNDVHRDVAGDDGWDGAVDDEDLMIQKVPLFEITLNSDEV